MAARDNGMRISNFYPDNTKKELALEGDEFTDIQKEAMKFVLPLSDDELRRLLRIGKAMIEE